MVFGSKRARDDGSSTAGGNGGKRAAKTIKISGGPVQPPRVIGYKRTNANVDICVRVEKRSFPLHTKVLAAGSGFFQVSCLPPRGPIVSYYATVILSPMHPCVRA